MEIDNWDTLGNRKSLWKTERSFSLKSKQEIRGKPSDSIGKNLCVTVLDVNEDELHRIPAIGKEIGDR